MLTNIEEFVQTGALSLRFITATLSVAMLVWVCGSSGGMRGGLSICGDKELMILFYIYSEKSGG